MSKATKATHMGELKIGDLLLPCAVLEDGTRVISERGMTKALGGKRGGSHWRRMKQDKDGAYLPVFLSAGNLKPYISSELASALNNPIIYQPANTGGIAHGIKAEMLPEMLDVWLKARDDGGLHHSQEHIATKANILMRGLAHVGVVALVDEATGYQDVRARDELGKILDAFVAKELLPWAKRFPDEFYKQLFRLRGWKYKPFSVKRPSYVGKLTNELIYDRLPPGVKDELQEKNPVVDREKWRRKHKHHQFLTNDVGHPYLDRLLSGVVALMRASANWREFKRMFERAYPKPGITQHELPGVEIEH